MRQGEQSPLRSSWYVQDKKLNLLMILNWFVARLLFLPFFFFLGISLRACLQEQLFGRMKLYRNGGVRWVRISWESGYPRFLVEIRNSEV